MQTARQSSYVRQYYIATSEGSCILDPGCTHNSSNAIGDINEQLINTVRVMFLNHDSGDPAAYTSPLKHP